MFSRCSNALLYIHSLLFLLHQAVQAGATVLLAASVFHFGIIGIGDLKDYLRNRGVTMP